jgi:hypothetical protein
MKFEQWIVSDFLQGHLVSTVKNTIFGPFGSVLFLTTTEAKTSIYNHNLGSSTDRGQ